MRFVMAMMVVVLAAPASGQYLYGNAYFDCRDGAHVISISGYDYEHVAGQYDHLVLCREAVGVCEPMVFLDDHPLPLATVDHGEYDTFGATVTLAPPRNDVVYRYEPYAVRPDGTRQVLWGGCDADGRGYALSDCGTAPFLRARLIIAGMYGDHFTFFLQTCTSDCWTEHYYGFELSDTELERLSGLPWYATAFQIVDVYGSRTYCGMMGSPSHTLTRIALVPGGGCEVVATESSNWGSVKAMYR